MMAYVQEIEMFACLVENFRLAAEQCDRMAVSLRRGRLYKDLIENLRLCENCCRQVAKERGDARWLVTGFKMEEAHQRAGTWLRKYVRQGRDRKLAHDLFKKLAEQLRFIMAEGEKMRHAATERVGPVLPREQAPPLRDTRPVAVRLPSGLIVPREYVH